MAKLQILQNKLLKLLTKKDRRYSTNKLHIDLNILKVKHIYEMSVLTFVHGCVRGIPIDSFKIIVTSEAIHTIIVSETTKISHQTRSDPTSVQTQLTQ